MFETNIHNFLLNLGYTTNNLPFQFVLEKQYRFPSIGKSAKNRAASIVLKSNGTYLIYDHATGDNHSFNPEWEQNKADRDEARIEQQHVALQKQREADAKIIQFKRKSDQAQQIWNKAQPCLDHPYMQLAGHKIAGEIRTLPIYQLNQFTVLKNPLIIPLFDAVTHELVNLQFITLDKKRFLSGAKKQGTYFKIEGDADKPTIFAEGYKTAVALHHATGQTVVMGIDANNLKTIYQSLAQTHDFAFADNDNKAKKSEVDLIDEDGIQQTILIRKSILSTKELKTYGTGHKVLSDIGANFYLSPFSGSDAADLKPEVIQKVIADRFHSDIQIFSSNDVWKQLDKAPCSLSSKEIKEELKACADDFDCAVLVHHFIKKNLLQVPRLKNLMELRKEIEFLCSGKVHPITLDNIILFADSRLNWLKDQNLEQSILIDADSYKKHNHIKINHLDELKADFSKGVYLLKAPTGTGKTKKGSEFGEWCADNGKPFFALAHLRSLIAEMCKVLKTEHYEELKADIRQAKKNKFEIALLLATAEKIACCLPSIGFKEIRKFSESCKHVFIDEISQLLEIFSEPTLFKNTDIEEVFDLLKAIIREADCIVFADANINIATLQFIEQCRPGERFNIIEITPIDEGKVVNWYHQSGEFRQAIFNEVVGHNRNLWITTDSKAEALAIEKQLKDCAVNCISIVGNKVNTIESKEFLADVDAQSKNYQVVIASPAISSGISVENNHFDTVFGLFCGLSVQPTDAYQMLGRVRSCKEFHVYADQKHHDAMEVENILNGKQQAGALEFKVSDVTDFAKFSAEIDRVKEQRKSNFANNLFWILESKKFSIHRIGDYLLHGEKSKFSAYDKDAQDTKKQEREEYIQAVIHAVKIDKATADALNREAYLSEGEILALDAFNLRSKLRLQHYAELNPEHFEINIQMLKRYRAFMNRELSVKSYDKEYDKEKDLYIRKYAEALPRSYKLAFQNLSIAPDAKVSHEDAISILREMMTYRFMLASIGAIPKKFGTKNYKIGKYPIQDLNLILEHVGLGTYRTRNSAKVGQMYCNLYIKTPESVPNDAEKIYLIDGDLIKNNALNCELYLYSKQTDQQPYYFVLTEALLNKHLKAGFTSSHSNLSDNLGMRSA